MTTDEINDPMISEGTRDKLWGGCLENYLPPEEKEDFSMSNRLDDLMK